MTAYYNEHDTFAAAWLRELIADGRIAPGEVDTRSIEDVRPGDLIGFTQCHFFAGIGVWSFALRKAGWADDRAIWTGSCPCQPFSAAGKGGGFADERHLWPAFFHLIEQCGPPVVAGEQVASKDGLAWLDLVQTDLEAAGYAFGAVDTCAAGFGAPHIRQRLYWAGTRLGSPSRQGPPLCQSVAVEGTGRREKGRATEQPGCASGRLADAGWGLFQHQQQRSDDGSPARSAESRAPERKRPGPTNGLWRNVDWLGCRDGKWRPVEPGAFPLAHAGAFRNRVAELRGAGNALNIGQATGFIEALLGGHDGVTP